MFRLVRLWFAAALFIVFNTHLSALAQTSDDTWAVPLNLSHSGIAVNPTIVIDSESVVHAVWEDDLENFVYSRLDGDQWSAPETTNLDILFRLPPTSESMDQSPLEIYTGPNPLFLAGPNHNIFAFWISPQGRLFTSQVVNQNFEQVGAWNARGLITPGVVSFAAAIDARGEWHLVYFRTVDEPAYPAGIYYIGSRNNGRNWAVPVLLYKPTYFRSLSEGEANLSIATAGTEEAVHVFIAWDSLARKQVWLAQSADSGKSWEQPMLIAGPAPGSGLAGPFNIRVGTNQNSVVLVWQNGEPAGGCSQIYQFSRDAGAIWSDPQRMIKDLSGCTQSNQFVTEWVNGPEGPLYFLTETQSQTYLSAWNGSQWSEPQEQPVLDVFEDPEIFTQVDFGCHRASLLKERLYIIGCDQGEGGDVWVTSRDLESATSWFKPPIWSQLSSVTDDNFKIEIIELVATDDGLIHAFFNQRQDPAIYYTYWDGELWSRITPVLKLPDGEADEPAIVTGPGNELLLIAKSNRGALYFSRATSGNAATASGWSTLTQLGNVHDGEVGSVDVALDTAGTMYVAYSVPVNEERGIYLVFSKDQGTTWSEPLQVFDGAAAGFDLVGSPSLLASENGFLHIIWKQQSIQGDGVPQPLSLYYTRSENSGHTFNDAEMVVEEPVAWQEIVTDGKGNLHLLWQSHDTLTTVWDQVSLDGGNSWQYPQGFPDEGSFAAVTSDPAGRLHVVGAGPGALGHWLWDGNRWQSEVPLSWPVSSQQETPVELLAAAVNKQGKMMVVMAESIAEGDVGERTLVYSTRTLKLPAKQTAIQDVPTETLASPTVTVETLTPEPLLTSTTSVDNQSDNQGQPDRIEPNDRVSPFTVALLPVALLLLSVLAIVIRRAIRVKDQ